MSRTFARSRAHQFGSQPIHSPWLSRPAKFTPLSTRIAGQSMLYCLHRASDGVMREETRPSAICSREHCRAVHRSRAAGKPGGNPAHLSS